MLKDIRISNKSLTQTKGFEDYDISQLKKLKLKNNQTTLTFLFTGLNYLMPENNTYEYMLEGFDEKWNKAGSQGIAHYSFIPAGNYTLKIKAFNNDGLSGDNMLHLPIKILPPFWMSWPAILLYLAVITLALYLWKSNTLKYAKLRHNLHLNELEKKRINEMHEVKTKLFADVSHEIKTPLSLIIGPVDEMIERNKMETKDRKKLESVQYHSKYLLRLINQLLKIDRIEKKKEKENKQPVHIKNYLLSIDNAYKPVAEINDIHWNVNVRNLDNAVLLIDKDNLDTILINLLSNAFKFSSTGDSITLTAISEVDEFDKHKLIFHVKDTGTGIKQEDIPYIFDRYFKANQHLKTGTGIGLSLAKEIVTNLMHGSIHVRSEIGKGSVFTIELNNIEKIATETENEDANIFVLPVEFIATQETVAATSNSAYKDENAKILIIEDNISLLNFLIEDLNKNYSVHPATSAEAGETIIEENDIDLIISDIMLPVKNGDVFCAEIKSNIKTSHIPVILLTAISDENKKLEGLESGADDYIFKPFNLKELSLKVNNILKQRAKWRELYNYQTLNNSTNTTAEKKYNSYDEELLRNIDAYIEKNISNTELTVEDIGHEVALSRAHLFRKIKKLTGLSLSQYIRNFRLKKAKEILEKEDIRIQELSEKMGFKDQNYFGKCFKDAYGFSPTDVRNKIS